MADANINYFLGPYEGVVLQTLKTMQKNRVIQRIWDYDYTVWKAKPDHIINRLGWLTAPYDTLRQLSYISDVIDPVIAEGYKDVVLLGMGGSSLAAEVFKKIFGNRDGCPNLHILDTTDPITISHTSQKLNPSQTLFLVSSKSGTTLETVSLFHYFYNLSLKKAGKRAGRHFIVITDPDSPLEELAPRFSLRHIFLSNSSIGGRYSALSLPGIVPAALLGIDIEKLLENALSAAKKESAEFFNGKINAGGAVLGAALGTLAKLGRNKLTFMLPPSWMPLGSWLEQLIAESTGKEGRGILPLFNEPLMAPVAYNDDRIFVVFSNKEKTNSPKVSALIATGYPVITIKLNNKFQLGGQMFCWEMATAVASHILDINPFDQPDVEASKILTRRMIDLYRHKEELPQEEAALTTKECDYYGYTTAATPAAALADFLVTAPADAYICLQIYLESTPETDAALLKLRAAIRKIYRLAVTIGYGPRYLHSTGQLHKGDAGHGLFIQLTADDRRDIKIPDRPCASASTLTFGVLKSAQAMGDRQALIKLHRKVIRLHLKKNVATTVEALASSLKKCSNNK